MRNKILIALLSFYSVSFSQNEKVQGKWYGKIEAMGITQIVAINIDDTANTLKGNFYNIEYIDRGVALNSISFKDNILGFTIKAGNSLLTYIGTLEDERIKGVFTQGIEFDLVFQRDSILKEEVKRPQEPRPPCDYYTEDITIKNKKSNIDLAGTLTLPSKEGKFPVVILISGSGPQNRNSEVLGHKPFLLWADYLAKNGIGSFRYDERGIGESTGKYSTADLNDFYADAKSMIKVISKRKEVTSLGILGHSEGGIIAPWLASNCKKIDFIVMLAGPGAPVTELMAEQRKLTFSNMGVSEVDIITNNKMFEEIDEAVLSIDKTTINDSLFKIMTASFNKMEDERYKSIQFRMQVTQQNIALVSSRWYKSFVAINPADYLTKVKQPVFAINGDKDLQVASYQNIPAIEKALSEGNCKNYTTKVYPGLNHLFQQCETGMVTEYGSIEETVNPAVLKDVTDWINDLSK
jgi:alpha-beta hydrolase superfamily lysophospholipase